MDRHIREHLEEYLRGRDRAEEADPTRMAEFQARLQSADQDTRRTVAQFEQHAQMLHRLRPAEEVEPAPGFYARVMGRIETQRRGSLWAVFLEPAFSRKLAIASLALLVLMTITMYTTAPEDALITASPVYVMGEDVPWPDFGANQAQDREALLVTLSTYQE